MGEFEKRIKWRAFSSDSDSFTLHNVLEVVGEAKKDLPNPEEIQMVLAQLLNFVPKSEVRDNIQKHLEREYSATWKWFGDSTS